MQPRSVGIICGLGMTGAILGEYPREIRDLSVGGGGWQLGVAAWRYQAQIVVFMEGAKPMTFCLGLKIWGLRYSANQDGAGGHYDVPQARSEKTRPVRLHASVGGDTLGVERFLSQWMGSRR